MILRWEDFLGAIGLLVFMSVFVGRKYKSNVAGLLFFWVFACGLWVCFNPALLESIPDMSVRLVSAKSLVGIALLSFFILTMNFTYDFLFFLMEIAACVEAILLYTKGYGFFNACSMGSPFVVIAWTSSLLRPKKKDWAFFVIAVLPLIMFFSPRVGKTMFVVMVAEIIAYVIVTKRKKILYALPVVLGLGYWFNPAVLNLNRNDDRITNWKFFTHWIIDNNYQWLGTGTGTFKWVGPMLQQKKEDLFLWMHNDWLQIVFEQGLLGLILALSLFFVMLKRTREVPWLFCMNIGFATAMVTQFPLRYFAGQALAALLIGASLEQIL